MKIRVVYSVWGADGFDEPLAGGDHDLDAVTEAQARSIAAAEAAGAVEVLEASAAEKKLAAGHVQSQADGEAAQAAAMGEWVEPVKDAETGALLEPGYWTGGWHAGNLRQFVAGRTELLAYDEWLKTADPADLAKASRSGDLPAERRPLTDEQRAVYEAQIARAEEGIRKAEPEEVTA